MSVTALAFNPSPPGTERATTDAVASLQSQVNALQEKIRGMELKDLLFLYKEIKDLRQAQSEKSQAPFDSQFKALQDQIDVLELTKREFNTFKRSEYKVDIPYLDAEIRDLNKAQSRDKASFDSQIAKLQREVDSFPGILARVQTLESSLATLQRPAAKPPAKTRPWPFGTEQPPLLDSRADRQSQARVRALLHEMHEVRDLLEFNQKTHVNTLSNT